MSDDETTVLVPPGFLIHIAIDDTCSRALCEAAGRDWTGTRDMYLVKPRGPLAGNATCRDCIEWRHA